MKRYSKKKIIGLVQKIPQHPDNKGSKLHQALTALVVRHLEELGQTITLKDIMLAISKGGADLKATTTNGNTEGRCC